MTSRLQLAIIGGILAWVLVAAYRANVFGGERPPLVALLHVPGVEFGLIVLGILGWVTWARVKRDRLRKRFPNEPWMWEHRWDRLGARPEAKGGTANLGNAIAAVVLATAAFAVVGGIVLTEFIPRSDTLAWSLRVSGAAALAAWAWLGILLAPRLARGRLYFRYESFPFLAGQWVAGEVEGLDRFPGLEQVIVGVTCTRVRTEYDNLNPKRPTYKYTTLYEDRRAFGAGDIVPRAAIAGGGSTRKVLPVHFDIPLDAPSSALEDADIRRWTVRVVVKRKGLDVDDTFLVPVYKAPIPSELPAG